MSPEGQIITMTRQSRRPQPRGAQAKETIQESLCFPETSGNQQLGSEALRKRLLKSPPYQQSSPELQLSSSARPWKSGLTLLSLELFLQS